MYTAEVASLYDELDTAGIVVWIDGGWGVDALLGEETRPNYDLDIAIEFKDGPRLRVHLAACGYAEVRRADPCTWMFLMEDAAGRRMFTPSRSTRWVRVC